MTYTLTQFILGSLVALTLGVCVGVMIAALMSRSKMDDLEMEADSGKFTLFDIRRKIASHEEACQRMKPSSAVLFAWKQDLLQDIKNTLDRYSTNG